MEHFKMKKHKYNIVFGIANMNTMKYQTSYEKITKYSQIDQ